MPGWLNRWLDRGPRSSRLAVLLADYPRYELPHPGPGRRLKVAQARDNLRYLLDHREQRLQALDALLRNFQIELRPGLSAADPRPLLDALDRWASAEWPAVHIAGIGDPVSDNSDAQRWEESTKVGADIALSMLMDTAIALGEVVTSRRQEFAWQLDLEPSNRGMRSYRRPVVMRAADPQRQWAAVVLDFEAECINDFDWLGRSLSRTQPLGYTALAALSGGYDPPSEPALEQPEAVVPSPTVSGVYDKADYHAQAVEDYGLPGEQAAVPGAFFLGWVIEQSLYSSRFASEKKSLIAAWRQRKTTALDIYLKSDGSLTTDMLNDAGNEFAQEYFRADAGGYWADYDELFGAGLPSLYHAPYGWEQQARINARLDQRYQASLQGRGGSR
jgi:hypothetical protein